MYRNWKSIVNFLSIPNLYVLPVRNRQRGVLLIEMTHPLSISVTALSSYSKTLATFSITKLSFTEEGQNGREEDPNSQTTSP